jgi:hypothetical protein
MALTDFQRQVCRLLAGQRIASGESYVADGTALNEALSSSRISRDIDLFHDTDAALESSWQRDREWLLAQGWQLRVLRDRPGLVEAEVSAEAETVVIEWSRDSAFRFFPLVEHADFGLVLHPFDLATNKVLALAGRLEPRDWIDVILSSERLQPLGYLAWAACGKDPGFGPSAILEHAARGSRYSPEELRGLAFAGAPPDPADLSRRWHGELEEARRIVAVLPAEEAGTCVLSAMAELYRGSASDATVAAAAGALTFHRGRIKGAYPVLVKREG